MDKETFGQRLRRLRETKGLTQEELADKAGISRPYVSELERDKRKERLSYQVVIGLSNALDVSPGELQGEASAAKGLQPTSEMRIKGYVSAGIPRQVWEVDIGTLPVPLSVLRAHPKAYALIVSGDSLEGDGIHNGDYLIIDPESGLQASKIYVIRLGDELVARHVHQEGNFMRLKSSNSHYEDIKVGEFHPLGRVVYHMRGM